MPDLDSNISYAKVRRSNRRTSERDSELFLGILRTIHQSFMEEVGALGVLLDMVEYLPGVNVSIKDRSGRYLYACSGMRLQLGLNRPEEVIGTTDRDLFPQNIAEGFIKADEKVIKEGCPIYNYREAFYSNCDGLVWSITSKWPLKNQQGKTVGVLGVFRPVNGTEPDSPESGLPGLTGDVKHAEEIERITDFISSNCDRTLTNEEIAKAVGVSTRKLTRIIQETHLLSPRNFATMIRIQLACKALSETDAAIIDVAQDHGFSCQSSFTTQFKKITGTTPRQFRLRSGSIFDAGSNS